MLIDKKRKEIRQMLPVDDPKYIAFKKLKGVLGVIDTSKTKEVRTSEVITRYKCGS